MNLLPMLRIQFLILVCVAVCLPFGSVAQAKSDITTVIPESELIGAQTFYGEIRTEGVLAVQAASEELSKYGLKLADFASVGVFEAGTSFHVTFSMREIGATYFGSPGLQRPILVRVDRKDFKVLGSYQYFNHT
jgi:hypothetical protein